MEGNAGLCKSGRAERFNLDAITVEMAKTADGPRQLANAQAVKDNDEKTGKTEDSFELAKALSFWHSQCRSTSRVLYL